ncbi:hypothetical protein GPECTOR_43g950 [Gonium pectorale]|uniref:Uncharacterized protein n=1 Tax=Gonium pectorale TaxID=33097 RepID=A0A150G9S0_GONPE|nr:hypothetical protein GPECTOR_43g950 [Gonium pectorale]|eukprot:KXZ46513.1 hypothetical protein GPECTOR_43g950 [Gonium pectorale]
MARSMRPSLSVSAFCVLAGPCTETCRHVPFSCPSAPELYAQRIKSVPAPSQLIPSVEQQLPGLGPLLLNWRPDAGAAGLLPELTDPVFTAAVARLISSFRPDEASLLTAGLLCQVTAKFYSREAELSRAIITTLEDYLLPEDDPSVEEVYIVRRGFADRGFAPAWALGDKAVSPTNVYLAVELGQTDKAGVGDSGDSHYKGGGHHVHFWRLREARETFKATYCPAFLLEVVGSHIRLSSLAWLDRVTVFPLTPLLNLLPAYPATDRLLLPVARMLEVLRMGLRMLAARSRESKQQLVLPAGAKALGLPWHIAFSPRYIASTARRLAARTFLVELSDAARGAGRVEGSPDGGGRRMVVVKLGRGYGLAAHVAWAELGLAPQVLRVLRIPGGWQLVEMEYLPSEEWTLLHDLADADREGALQAALEALSRAHHDTAAGGTAAEAAARDGDEVPSTPTPIPTS